MPPINTYIAEIKFESGGSAITAILAESGEDAEDLLEFLCAHDDVKVDIASALENYKARVEILPGRRVSAFIQATGEREAKRLFAAMYGEHNIRHFSKAS